MYNARASEQNNKTLKKDNENDEKNNKSIFLCATNVRVFFVFSSYNIVCVILCVVHTRINACKVNVTEELARRVRRDSVVENIHYK